jgi:hypothetical protein
MYAKEVPTSPGGCSVNSSIRPRIQALSPTSLYRKKRKKKKGLKFIPKRSKALVYGDDENGDDEEDDDDDDCVSPLKKKKKSDCVRVDVRAILRLQSLQKRSRSTDSEEEDEVDTDGDETSEEEVDEEETEEETEDEEEAKQKESSTNQKERTPRAASSSSTDDDEYIMTKDQEIDIDESFTTKKTKAPNVKVEALLQDTEFSIGSEVSVWWKDGKAWDGKVVDIILNENAVVVGFPAPYDTLDYMEVYCIDGGSIAPKGQLHTLRRLRRLERQVFETRSRELTHLWLQRNEYGKISSSSSTAMRNAKKSKKMLFSKTTTTTTTTTSTKNTTAANEYWGLLGEDFQWYDRLSLWSCTLNILGKPAHLGYFREIQSASKVIIEVNRRVSNWTYKNLLTARYQLFDAHNHFARRHGGIIVGTNGRVYIKGDLRYSCAGGRQAEGRYGEMLPAFIHKMILECHERLGKDKLSKATIYDLGAGMFNVGAQFAHEIDGCRVVGTFVRLSQHLS